MDPIGEAIYNFYFARDREMIRVDSNYTEDEEIDPAWFFRDFKEMPEIEQRALNLCHGKILDVGAGAGCHALELQARGLEVMAIEKSEKSFEVLHARGIHQSATADIFEFSGHSFDTILMLMNGAGVAGTLAGLEKLLLHLKTLLNTSGQLLLDSSDIMYLFQEDDGSLWVDLTKENYYGEMTYHISYKENCRASFPWIFVDSVTLAEVAEKAGFRVEILMEGEQNDYLARLTCA